MSLFIKHDYIEETIKNASNPPAEDIRGILEKARKTRWLKS